MTVSLLSRADGAYDHLRRAITIYKKWDQDKQRNHAESAEPLDAALRELEQARQSHPKDFDVLFWLGFVKINQRRYEASLEPLLTATNPDSIRSQPPARRGVVYADLGFACYSLQRYAEASRWLEQAVGEFEKRLAKEPNSRAARSDLRRALFDWGDALLRRDMPALALAAYRRCDALRAPNVADQFMAGGLDAAPLDEANIQAAMGMALKMEGDRLARAGKKAEAEAAYAEFLQASERAAQASIAEEPANQSHFWLLLAEAQKAAALRALSPNGTMETTGREHWERANDAYAKALASDAHNPELREAYGRALAEQGRDSEALTQFALAAQDRRVSSPSGGTENSAPILAATQLQWGLAAWRQNRAEEARSHFAQAVALDPKNADAWHALGTAQFAQKRYDLAGASFQKSIEYHFNYSQTHRQLGATYAEQQNWQAAFAEFEIAERQMQAERKPDPEQVALLDYDMGVALTHLADQDNDPAARPRRFGEAADRLRTASLLGKRDPVFKDGTALHIQGVALHKAGRVDEAIPCYKQAVDEAARSQTSATPPDLTRFRLDLGLAQVEQALRKDAPDAPTSDQEAWIAARDTLAGGLASVDGGATITDEAVVRVAYAETLLRLADVAHAIPQLKLATSPASGVNALNQREQANALSRLGQALERMGYLQGTEARRASYMAQAESVYAQAEAALRQQAAPTSQALQDVIRRMGETQWMQGNFKDPEQHYSAAEQTFARALRLAPDDTNLALLRYDCLVKLEQEAGARQGRDTAEGRIAQNRHEDAEAANWQAKASAEKKERARLQAAASDLLEQVCAQKPRDAQKEQWAQACRLLAREYIRDAPLPELYRDKTTEANKTGTSSEAKQEEAHRRYAQAEQLYNRSLAVFPDPHAESGLGLIALENAQWSYLDSWYAKASSEQEAALIKRAKTFSEQAISLFEHAQSGFANRPIKKAQSGTKAGSDAGFDGGDQRRELSNQEGFAVSTYDLAQAYNTLMKCQPDREKDFAFEKAKQNYKKALLLDAQAQKPLLTEDIRKTAEQNLKQLQANPPPSKPQQIGVSAASIRKIIH